MPVTQLPALLAPWRPWLSLFPAELAAPLGQLLLRLHPQIGPLRSAPARSDAMPEGVGSIVARGPYERMLISEWAVADAEPDEFIRRAGSGELLFTGPEPAARKRSRRCVALFDAGPAQLGEPRLLHLALFSLLARRAEKAGALFEWGILQNPVTLRSDSGTVGIARLLKARTLRGVDAEARDAWRDAIDSGADDLWIIGGHGLESPCPPRGQVAIRRSMLTEELEVSLTMQRSTRRLMLALPSAALGTRLLRAPFEPRASIGNVRQADGRASLQQPPRFAVFGAWLAVPQLDGGVMLYQVPASLKRAPGKPRHHPPTASGNLLAAGVFGKALGRITAEGENLNFVGFPSKAFNDNGKVTCERPDPKHFRAPPRMGRWLPTFFIRIQSGGSFRKSEEAYIMALDISGNLVCWQSSWTTEYAIGLISELTFQTLAHGVIGAAQFGNELHFACARENTTDIFAWPPGSGNAPRTSIPNTGSRLFFGKAPGWYGNGKRGLMALQLHESAWLVGNGVDWVTIDVEGGATVLGVAACTRHAVWGLVLRVPNKKSIELRGQGRRVLVDSQETIAQASLDPATANIAWIGAQSLRVFVQGIDEEKPYLQVMSDEAEHAA